MSDSVGRVVVVITDDGTKYKVKGAARFTEPPQFPPDAPGIIQNTEIELDQAQAADIRRHFEDSLRAGHRPVLGRDWKYVPPVSGSIFVEVFDTSDVKLASFNPLSVEAVYFEDACERDDD